MERLPSPPEVEIRTSTKRRKTASARWQDGRIIVLVPAQLSVAERTKVATNLAQRVIRKKQLQGGCSNQDLDIQARELADRYVGGVRPATVRWVTNQNISWGSCSPHSGEIRVSDRLQPVPSWVLDAVLVHELAHLVEPGHTRNFHKVANRYPRMAEARTFLAGFGLGLSRVQGNDFGQGYHVPDDFDDASS
ncbi:MAG: M48 family metallopeptidase [Actinobacteria bacterium]|nr:M48 family metallopeptidase [Actinomycetota bacterium]MCL5447080.1 M48 family metallopeptidase [Actinomycetota bacterium]